MLPASNRGLGVNLGFPDVCNTPAGPVTVPIPYPNIALNVQAVPFSPVVKVSMMNALNMMSRIPMTSGDEAGVAHPMFKQAGAYTMGNPVVSIDGMPAINLTCPTTGNNFNNPLGAVLVPSAVNVLYCYAGAGNARAEALGAEQEALAALLVPDHAVGITLARRRGELVVGHVRRGSPAARLGLAPGDAILGLDGVPVAALGDAELPACLASAFTDPGRLELRVRDTGEVVRLPGLPAVTAQPPVRGRRLPGGLGYLEVSLFAQDAATWTERALAALEQQPLRALVVDVRGNPGGDLDAMLRSAGMWLPRGTALAREEEPDGDVRVHVARHGAARATPLVVLVDRLTASAAELFAGCLQHHGRALLVGERTYGKGAAWRAPAALEAARGRGPESELALPDGRRIQGCGLVPDLGVPPTEEDETRRVLRLRRAETLAAHADAREPDCDPRSDRVLAAGLRLARRLGRVTRRRARGGAPRAPRGRAAG
ncbi:MAG: DUF4150 domain-containing protein [Myxococcales bacterium]|nr:DUF4150 domain-containing protein [Myxococcales bacterium]